MKDHGWRAKSVMELIAELNEEERRILASGVWGPWRLNRELLTLTYYGPSTEYEIDLERAGSAGQMLDWIMQISGKSWADESVIGHLVRAFDFLFEPQALLCSFGSTKTIENPAEYLRIRFRDIETEKK